MMFVCQVCKRTFPAGGFCTEDGAPLSAAGGDPLLGTTIGSYQLTGVLGQGGMGTVYLGVHPNIGSRVAVKVLSHAAAENRDLVERFFSEARAVNVIRHEGIVNVLDLSTLPDGRPFIVMEQLEGAPLTAHFASMRPFPLATLVQLAAEVLGALGAAHAAGITHRDLKPDNVFVTRLGRPKVLDFGIAKLRPELGGQSDATRTGALLGTPQYMAPEQALGSAIDHRADLYSLGVILFEGATGRRPFDADALYELLRMHIQSEPPPPRALRPDIPPSLEAVILRALAKDPARRFQSAEEFAEALRAAALELGHALQLPTPAPGAAFRSSVAPTMPASASPSVGGTSSPLSTVREPPPRAGMGVWIGVAGVIVAVLGLGVAAIALLVGGGMFAASQGATAATSGDPAPEPDDGEGVDISAELPKMRAKAREKMPDAELMMISASGPVRGGRLSIKANTAVSYTFRSEHASKTSENCLTMVSVSQYGTHVSDAVADTGYKCKSPVTDKPRCQLRDVTAKAPPGAKIQSVSYMNLDARWVWIVVTEGPSVLNLPDTC
ncbi:MAG: protein kinase [Polyangiaceae bacterium]|nr:protein kinase [Polyangiaceae bacterium]